MFSVFSFTIFINTEFTGNVAVVKETAVAPSAVAVVFALRKLWITRN